MRRITAALFLTVLMVGLAVAASDELDVIRKVREFFDSFNKGELKSALEICATQSAIIDEFPPYVWQGATGCADWAKDFDAYATRKGITDAKVTLGRAHIEVAENRAYVVVPAQFAFKQRASDLPSRALY